MGTIHPNSSGSNRKHSFGPSKQKDSSSLSRCFGLLSFKKSKGNSSKGETLEGRVATSSSHANVTNLFFSMHPQE